MIGPRAIIEAATRIAPRIRRTPVLRLRSTAFGSAVPLTLKLENLQHTGSFKPRGAFARMLAAPLPEAGVIAASGGNHGAAVAYAARALGVRAEIFVPTSAPAAKIARIASYGARVMRVGAAYSDALAASRRRQTETDALEIHAYDHPDVLAGQGTVGQEFEADAPELTHVLVATGGGGLIGGIAAWYSGRVDSRDLGLAAGAAMTDPVLIVTDARGVATATLNRPEIANAYNEDMLDALIAGLRALAADPAVRCLVLRGAGRHFQAGADINWLAEVAGYDATRGYKAAMATTRACQLLNEFPKPTIALVHGACFGGGAGMVCCVDVAFATPEAMFGLTEVRVGVAPTPISTHMVHAMGLRHTRRYALTGERFGAAEARRIGLVHEVIPAAELEARLAAVIDAVLLGGPAAIVATKRSFLGANGLVLDERAMAMLARESWTQRASPEGREGTAAFREKRKPSWYPSGGSA